MDTVNEATNNHRERLPLTITLPPELCNFIERCMARDGASESLDEFFDLAVILFRAQADYSRAFSAFIERIEPDLDVPAAFARIGTLSEDKGRTGETPPRVIPCLHEAATVHWFLWRNRMSAPSEHEIWVRAISETTGAVITCDPLFPDIVRAEWPKWSPPLLPEPLIAAIQGSPEPRFAGRVITVTASARQGVLFLQASVRKLGMLTEKQRRVAELLVKGLSTEEIACELNVLRSTINLYRKTIYRVLGVGQLSELAEALQKAPLA